ncbi:hypothetical protein BJ741DRAFT_601434 [Chytriomyces cf. hyalinus JEL632]|nr:hypothetical protein BJ741DRAFT_601434 [Chytriomyces cf. hyalinus JEL632]
MRTDSSEHMHPSHYTASMIDAKSFQPISKDTDETLSHLLSCLSTAQVIDPTLAPFSSPMSTAPNSRRGSNLDDVMIQQHVHQHHHFNRPAMLTQSHESSFRKMGSQVECATAIKSLSSLSLPECDAPETQPLTSFYPPSNSGVSSTALECIKLNMMGLSVRDEAEEESTQDWQHSHRHRRSTRPASASPTRRIHTLLQKPVTARTTNSLSASMPSSYAYDASLSSRRHKDSSWRRRVPRTVCNVGTTTTTVSFADEDVLMCGSTNMLRDDHDARLRRRHPYYRPALVSAMSRNRSEASTIGELSHALWMRQRE